MKLRKLKLITETDTHYIFEVSYVTGFLIPTKNLRIAIKDKTETYPRWMDTSRIIIDHEGIDAWLSTDKEEFFI